MQSIKQELDEFMEEKSFGLLNTKNYHLFLRAGGLVGAGGLFWESLAAPLLCSSVNMCRDPQDIGLDGPTRGSYILSNHCPEMEPQTAQLPGNIAHRVLAQGEPRAPRPQALQPNLCHELIQLCHHEVVPSPLVLREQLIITH